MVIVKTMNTLTVVSRYTIVYETILYCVCCVGDHIYLKELDNLPARTLTDSITHGLVGFLSWSIVVDLRNNTQKLSNLVQCILCMVLAILVDVDYAIDEGLVFLKEHSSIDIPLRHSFHVTSIIFPISVILWTFGDVYKRRLIKALCPIFVIAWLSHHVRDAIFNELQLIPFGVLPKFTYYQYIGVTMALPVFCRILLLVLNSDILKECDKNDEKPELNISIPTCTTVGKSGNENVLDKV